MARREELADEQWAIIEPHLPKLFRREDGRGRPWRDNREVINGILWILRSGARWKDLTRQIPAIPVVPQKIPSVGQVRRVAASLGSVG